MSAKIEIAMDTLFSIVDEVNKGNKTIEDFALEMGTSKRTIQRKLQDNGFIAYRGYNVWSAPGETKEEVLAKYRPHAVETSNGEEKPQGIIKQQQPRKEKPKPRKNLVNPQATTKGEKTKRLNIELNRLTFVKLKLHSVKTDTSMTDIVTKLIEQYLKDTEK